MLKLVLGFITGIIFTVFIAFALANYPSWLNSGGQSCDIHNYSPVFQNDKFLYIESSVFKKDGDHKGYIHAISLKNKDERWRFATEGVIQSKIYAGKDLIYLQRYNELDAINPETGELIWSKSMENISMIGSLYCNNQLINQDPDSLYAYDIDRGELNWHLKLSSRPTGKIICSENELIYTSSDGFVRALDLETGKENWTASIKY